MLSHSSCTGSAPIINSSLTVNHPIPFELQLATALSKLQYPSAPDLPWSPELHRIKKALRILSHSCIFCWLSPSAPLHDHSLSSCQHPSNPIYTQPAAWLKWKEQLALPVGTCFACGLPQHVSLRSYSSLSVSSNPTPGILHRTLRHSQCTSRVR